MSGDRLRSCAAVKKMSSLPFGTTLRTCSARRFTVVSTVDDFIAAVDSETVDGGGEWVFFER